MISWRNPGSESFGSGKVFIPICEDAEYGPLIRYDVSLMGH